MLEKFTRAQSVWLGIVFAEQRSNRDPPQTGETEWTETLLRQTAAHAA